MKNATEAERRRARFEALYAEAKQAFSYAANQVRALTEQARQVHGEVGAEATDGVGADVTAEEMGREQAALERLELAVRSLEHDWLFLERGGGLAPSADGPGPDPELQMRLLEAQEAERARLAQEIHDGPAQAISNAVLLVDVVDRTIERDADAARVELRKLRTNLERELHDMRGFINQLRPPLLDQLGLDGALRDAASSLAEGGEVEVQVDLGAPADLLTEARQTVVLRVAQESLRNVRKHAGARVATVSTRLEGAGAPAWALEVRDDGRGFDLDEVMGDTSRRRFGLRFMRDRARAVGATLDIHAEPATGTTVRLTMNVSRRETS